MLKRNFSVALLGIATLAVSGCGAGKAVRPQDPTYNGAANGGGDDRHAATGICHKVDAEGTPLVVDWRPEDRGDLEAAMRQGIAVVHYDCNALKLLPDCKADGSYGFVGITKKEQIISLNDADEAKANLPMNGGQLGAAIGRGAALDIALVMVGKSTATKLSTPRSALTGRCEGATHFVRSATVGAFAMKTRTGGKAESAASMFGVGASGSSTSDRSVANKEGELDACQKADIESTKAPKSCEAPLRVQLLALDKELDEAEAKKAALACPEGLTFVQGKCSRPVAKVTEACDTQHLDACERRCDAGEADPCSTVWMMAFLNGMTEDGEMSPNKVRSHKALERGCALGDTTACASLGSDYTTGWGVAKDEAKGEALMLDSCYAGDGVGCNNVGELYAKKDPRRAMRFWERACTGGNPEGCKSLGKVYATGIKGVRKDAARSHGYYATACALGSKISCDK